ncbi:GNAT family N-acetyltransferase [Halopiger xanaduensis]|uniref:GCN5-related N-acetyltransferase n=1 Tax=Halopiger xanaduensis (strain DSM 18323 / JCM 14033 / SH-6) TaxID=797210 RepID=F8D5K9_HALXS|nr:GNAT family N-acetyltransferase [Halopiger xanaduensis]AEH38845.1 GCN5-related N-acetyltransferase [Halopiger xanaduensis SH-6]
MELVEATADDLEALVDRWYALANAMEPYSELNELDVDGTEESIEDGFRDHLEDEEITDYLVVLEGETIGFVTLREGRHPSRRYSRYLRLVNLAIDDAHRNQGYGTVVVERVKETAREQGCDHLKVSCEWHNEDARRFYRDAGFQPKQVDYAQPLE